jgi:hypothetical protein
MTSAIRSIMFAMMTTLLVLPTHAALVQHTFTSEVTAINIIDGAPDGPPVFAAAAAAADFASRTPVFSFVVSS